MGESNSKYISASNQIFLFDYYSSKMNWGDISSDESEDEDMMVMPTEHAGLNDGFVGQVSQGGLDNVPSKQFMFYEDDDNDEADVNATDEEDEEDEEEEDKESPEEIERKQEALQKALKALKEKKEQESEKRKKPMTKKEKLEAKTKELDNLDNLLDE